MDAPHRHQAAAEPARRRIWGALTPFAFGLAGLLFVSAAVSSEGTDLRASRYSDLADLARTQEQRAEGLSQRRAELEAEVARMSAALAGSELEAANAQVERLREPAGLEPIAGSGVEVTLRDAPAQVLADSIGEIERKLVHQQDIQAVANAMWAAGADAVTVQGQRIVSTTGIKCVGNSVILHGVAYAPPYVVAAIGDPQALEDRIAADPAVRQFLYDAAEFDLGFDFVTFDEREFPGYSGPITPDYARPLVSSNAS